MLHGIGRSREHVFWTCILDLNDLRISNCPMFSDMGLGGVGNMCSRDETMCCSQLDIDSLIDILGWSTIISTASTDRSTLPYKRESRSPWDQHRPAHRVGNSGAAGAAPAYQRRRVEKQQPRPMRVDKKKKISNRLVLGMPRSEEEHAQPMITPFVGIDLGLVNP